LLSKKKESGKEDSSAVAKVVLRRQNEGGEKNHKQWKWRNLKNKKSHSFPSSKIASEHKKKRRKNP
jgi:hypothetical protein